MASDACIPFVQDFRIGEVVKTKRALTVQSHYLDEPKRLLAGSTGLLQSIGEYDVTVYWYKQGTYAVAAEDLDALATEPSKCDSIRAVMGVFIIVLVAACGIAYHTAISNLLSRFLAWCAGLGWTAGVVVCLLTAMLSVLMLPTFPLMVGAGILFPKMYGVMIGELVGVASVFSGIWVGSMAAFLLGRRCCGSFASHESNKYDWMKILNKMIDEEGWWIVLLARMSPMLPAEVFNYVCSVTTLTTRGWAIGCCGSLVPVSFWVCTTALGSQAMTSTETTHKVSGVDTQGARISLIVLNIVVMCLLTSVLYRSFKRYKQHAIQVATVMPGRTRQNSTASSTSIDDLYEEQGEDVAHHISWMPTSRDAEVILKADYWALSKSFSSAATGTWSIPLGRSRRGQRTSLSASF